MTTFISSMLALLTVSGFLNFGRISVEDIVDAIEDLYSIESTTIDFEQYDQDYESGNFIVDETQTKIGKDFYEVFFNNWTNVKYEESFSVTISEKPLPQLGSRVSVLVNDFNIFEIDLPAKYDIIEEMALYAVESAKQFVVNYEQIQKDLEGSDLKGTGIF
ncbi:MAG: hypothetical protein HXY49_10575 [Ignavibacteriaceae bacterium]|jgi:curli production assembly/transport component CsgE|nr:hypothetical protein [Ignavibacteriaceae bacterium]